LYYATKLPTAWADGSASLARVMGSLLSLDHDPCGGDFVIGPGRGCLDIDDDSVIVVDQTVQTVAEQTRLFALAVQANRDR
jgi:hypothetical protein